MRKVNLVLVPDDRHHDPQDFVRIAAKIRALCTDVVPHVCLRHHLLWRKWRLSLRPTLYVASGPAKGFRPIRGLVLAGVNLAKSEQYRRLEEQGIPVPKWQLIGDDTLLSHSQWARYVVVKPDRGRRGADVKIRATNRIKGNRREDNKVAMLAQEFIYTGAEPAAYRALTLFGRLLYLEYSRNIKCGNPLSGPDSFHETGGHNIVAGARGATRKLVKNTRVQQYAEDVATRCFQDIPLLGLDIIQDANTGELFIAEANPYGQTWHFSSVIGKSMQGEHRFDYAAQFGAFDIAAQRLMEVARERAV